MMRTFSYARMTPEARKGFPVFVVIFAVVVIGATIWAQDGLVNGFWTNPTALPSCN
jgi:hypothetical protein